MKTNILNIIFTALLAHLMSATVVLAHIHAKDAVSLANQQSVAKISGGDITAKAVADLHHHIDKTSLKMQSSEPATQARIRELQPLLSPDFDLSLRDYFEDLFIRFQFGASLFFRQFVYIAVP